MKIALSVKGTVKFGSLFTFEDRFIVFSNEFQHKVNHVENISKTENAERKILCFFGTIKKYFTVLFMCK